MLWQKLLGACPVAEPPSIIGTTSRLRGAIGSGTLTVDVPTHQANDLLFLAITVNNSSFVTSVPSGWVEVGKEIATAERLGLYYKLASSSEPASYNWTVAGEAAALSFSVRNATNYRISTFSTTTTNTGTINSVTTYSGGILIPLVGVDNTGTLSSVTNGTYTFGSIVSSGSSGSFSGSANLAVSTTTTDGSASGTSTGTISVSNGFAAVMLAVGP
jgi:hypothetical protein